MGNEQPVFCEADTAAAAEAQELFTEGPSSTKLL